MSTKGQLVIPAAVRKTFGLKPGDKLRVTLEGRSVRLESARATFDTSIKDPAALLIL